MNFAVCQDPNAGARAAAKERNNQKIANHKSNAVKWWNAEAIYDKKRKFINGMGRSRAIGDFQTKMALAQGQSFLGKESLVRDYLQKSHVDEGGGSRTAGRNKLLSMLYKKSAIESKLNKMGSIGEASFLTALDRRTDALLAENKSKLGLPPEFGPPTMMPPRDTFGTLLSGVQTGLSIYSGGMTAFGWGKISDLRLKRDVEHIGTSSKGYKIYEYSYAGNPIKRFRGAMAQDVMKKNPMAVHVNPRGFFLVDYNEIDVDFEEVN